MRMIGSACLSLARRALLGAIAVSCLAAGPSKASDSKEEVFLPAQGKGAIVVVVSGRGGPSIFRDISAQFASLGYYTVLIDGNDVWPVGGVAKFKAVIDGAQSAPQALPGKAALVGYSLGGLGVLVSGAQLDAQVSSVVAYYPAITGQDEAKLAAGFRVPILLLAGVKDQFFGCCKIETMRALAAAQKSAPFELVEFPDADHGFNLRDPRFTYIAGAADDAWARTVAFLGRMHPPGGTK